MFLMKKIANKFGLAIITLIAVLGIHSYICAKTKKLIL